MGTRFVADRLLGLRFHIPPGTWMFVLCVVSKEDKKAKCRIIKTKIQVRMKYRVQENTKKYISRQGRDLPHPSRPALGPIQLSIQWIRDVFPGGKAAGAWR